MKNNVNVRLGAKWKTIELTNTNINNASTLVVFPLQAVSYIPVSSKLTELKDNLNAGYLRPTSALYTTRGLTSTCLEKADDNFIRPLYLTYCFNLLRPKYFDQYTIMKIHLWLQVVSHHWFYKCPHASAALVWSYLTCRFGF